MSRYQKDFTGARDSEWQWHQLGMCKSAPRSRQIAIKITHQHLTTQFFTGRMPFLPPNQQCQSTEGTPRNLPKKFRPDPSTFYLVIVVTNRQTDRQTNAGKNIIPRFRRDNYVCQAKIKSCSPNFTLSQTKNLYQSCCITSVVCPIQYTVFGQCSTTKLDAGMLT